MLIPTNVVTQSITELRGIILVAKTHLPYLATLVIGDTSAGEPYVTNYIKLCLDLLKAWPCLQLLVFHGNEGHYSLTQSTCNVERSYHLAAWCETEEM